MTKNTIRVDNRRLDTIMMLRGVESDKKLAQMLGMTTEGVRRLRKRQSSSLRGLTRLCKALRCHPLDLLVMDGFPPPVVGVMPEDTTNGEPHR